MSLTKLIYTIFVPKKISFSPLTDIPKAMKFLSDLTGGKYVGEIEKHEFEKSQIFTRNINTRAQLLPLVTAALLSEKGNDIRETLFEHRELIHALYNNKEYVKDELFKILTELEVQTRLQERGKGIRHGSDTVIVMPGGGQKLIER